MTNNYKELKNGNWVLRKRGDLFFMWPYCMLENVNGYKEIYRKQVLEYIELSQTVLKEWGFFKRDDKSLWLYYWNESGESKNLGYNLESCYIEEAHGKLYFYRCLTEKGIEVNFLHELQNLYFGVTNKPLINLSKQRNYI